VPALRALARDTVKLADFDSRGPADAQLPKRRRRRARRVARQLARLAGWTSCCGWWKVRRPWIRATCRTSPRHPRCAPRPGRSRTSCSWTSAATTSASGAASRSRPRAGPDVGRFAGAGRAPDGRGPRARARDRARVVSWRASGHPLSSVSLTCSQNPRQRPPAASASSAAACRAVAAAQSQARNPTGRKILIRIDSAGAIHDMLHWLNAQRCRTRSGSPCPSRSPTSWRRSPSGSDNRPTTPTASPARRVGAGGHRAARPVPMAEGHGRDRP
jgi:hypothetical protein